MLKGFLQLKTFSWPSPVSEALPYQILKLCSSSKQANKYNVCTLFEPSSSKPAKRQQFKDNEKIWI